MTPQKAIEILSKMIAILEQPERIRQTNCLCGAYSYAINPNMTTDEIRAWSPDYKGMEEIGLFKPEGTANGLFWFKLGDMDIRIQYCKQAIKEWEKQL